METPSHIRQKKYRDNNPFKAKYRQFFNHAKSLGILVVGDCAYKSLGGCKGMIHAAHYDWRYPLDFRWICKKHHYLVDSGRLHYPMEAEGPMWILGKDHEINITSSDRFEDMFYGL